MDQEIIKELNEFRDLVAYYKEHVYEEYGPDLSEVRKKISRQLPRIKKYIIAAKIPTQISGRAPVAMGGAPFTMDIFDDMFLNERTPLAVDLNNTLDAIDKCIGIIEASPVETPSFQQEKFYSCGPLGNLTCNQRDFIEREYQKEKVFLDIPYTDYQDREKIIKEVVAASGLIPIVAKELLTSNTVLCKVCKIIQSCKYGISDISFNRQSVNYELGLMHGFGFKVCILLQESIEKFSDIEGLEHTSYVGEFELKSKLASWLLQNIPEVNRDECSRYIKEQEGKLKESGEKPFSNILIKKKDDEFKNAKVSSKEYSENMFQNVINEYGKRKLFLLSATPIPLEGDVIDTNDTKVRELFLRPQYSRGSGWHFGYSSFGSSMRPIFEGIEKSIESWRLKLFRNGYLEFSAEVNIHFSWSQNKEEYQVSPRFNSHAVTEFPVSFFRLLKQLAQEFNLTKSYVIKMAYLHCGKYKMRPYGPNTIAQMFPDSEKEAILDKWIYERIIEDLDFSTDKEAHNLIQRLYNTFGFEDDEIPFFNKDKHFEIPK